MEIKDNKLYAFLNTAVNSQVRPFCDAGYANGYVAIPTDHPYYGEEYSLIDEKLGICIHGGLTFSAFIFEIKKIPAWVNCTECIDFDSFNEIPDDYYVVGFDTIHFGDSSKDRDWCIKETKRLKEALSIPTKQPTPNPDTESDHQRDSVSDRQPDSVSASRPNSDIC